MPCKPSSSSSSPAINSKKTSISWTSSREMIISDHLFDRDRIFAHVNLDKDELRLYDDIYALLEARITTA